MIPKLVLLFITVKIAQTSSCFGPKKPYPAIFSFGEEASSVDAVIFSSNQDHMYLALRSKEPSWFVGDSDSNFKTSVMKYPGANPRDLQNPLWKFKVPTASQEPEI